MAHVLFYYDPVFLQHDTGEHPENARRIAPLAERLVGWATAGRLERPPWTNADSSQIELVHDGAYVQRLGRIADSGGGRVEQDTVMSASSYDVAVRAAGAACDAVRRVVAGESRSAFCLVRPPGHHALVDAPMGFCLLNNVAIAARVATKELGLQRVLIVDWDVHHGNGTQDAFWTDPQVGFFSAHRWPFYPGTGAADERGGGRGMGTTCNLPIAFGTSRSDYIERFAEALDAFAAEIRPELVFISAGFDAHRQDPIGSLGLESEDFCELTTIVQSLARQYAEGRLVSVMEGGYHPDAVLESASLHVEALIQGET